MSKIIIALINCERTTPSPANASHSGANSPRAGWFKQLESNRIKRQKWNGWQKAVRT